MVPHISINSGFAALGDPHGEHAHTAVGKLCLSVPGAAKQVELSVVDGVWTAVDPLLKLYILMGIW